MKARKSKNCFISLLTFMSLIMLLPIMLVSCSGGTSSIGGGGASSASVSKVVLTDIAPKSKSSANLSTLLAAESSSYQIPVGGSKQFYVYAVYSDNSVVNIPASSAKLTYQPKGLFIVNKLDIVSVMNPSNIGKSNTFTASYESVQSNPITINIVDPSTYITSICISDSVRTSASDSCATGSYSIPYGKSMQFYVYANYSDNHVLDITKSADTKWGLGQNTNIISVNDGLITSSANDKSYIGKSTTVTASYDSYTSSGVPIIISGATPTGVCVSNIDPNSGNAAPCSNVPDSYSIPYRSSKQVYVYETYNDGSYVNVTTLPGLTWNLGQSSDIISSPIQGGLITSAVGAGYPGQSTTITASYDGFTSSGVLISIADKAITSIVINSDPQQESAVVSLPYHLSVTATYDDNTTEVLAVNNPNLTFTSDHANSLSFNSEGMTAKNVTASFVATVTATYKSPVPGITVQPATIQIPVYPKQLILQWGNPVYNFLITSDPATITYNDVNPLYYYLAVAMYSNWENTAHMQWVSYANVKVTSNSGLIVYSTVNPTLHQCQDFTVTSSKSLKQCQYFNITDNSVIGMSGLSLTFTDLADPDQTTKTIGVTFN